MPAWRQDRPAEEGYYWKYSTQWTEPLLINVHKGSGGRLFTNWDGGAPVDDEAFARDWWWGPFEIQKPPDRPHSLTS